MSRYIDLLIDFSFKKIFGSEPNKDVLISFLNAIFDGRKMIVDIVYNKQEHVGDHKKAGSVIFDLTCTDTNGTQFLIEVQRNSQKNLKQRMAYYGCKLIADQIPRGKRKQWRYTINEVYVIVIIDGFSLFNTKSVYFYDFCLKDRQLDIIHSNELSLIYLELEQFKKEPKDLRNNLDQWLYVLKHLHQFENRPHFLNPLLFERLFDLAEFTQLTKNEQMKYDTYLKRKWDAYNILESAKEDAAEEGYKEGLEKGLKQGIESGLEKGIEKGIEQGIEQGIREGIKKGVEKNSFEIIQNLLAKELFTDEEIADLTNVTLDYVNQIRLKQSENK